MKRPHDEPVFPGPDDYSISGAPLYGPKNIEGLTKRELFAALAMQATIGLLGRSEYLDKFRAKAAEQNKSIEAVVGELSVNQADALLDALHPQPEAKLPEHKEVG